MRCIFLRLTSYGAALPVEFTGDPVVRVRPDAFKRCLGNLVANAQRHATRVAIEGVQDGRFLTVHIDDDVCRPLSASVGAPVR